MTTRGNDIVPTKIQETIFSGLSKKPENSECADCKANTPTWVSIDFGVFVCLRCSGVHRSLGPTITRVRSTKLDSFKFDYLNILASVGNRIANDYYENKMPSGYRRPSASASNDETVRFVTEKYVKKAFAPANLATPVERLLGKNNEDSNTTTGTQPAPSGTVIDLTSNCFDTPANAPIDLLSMDLPTSKPTTTTAAAAVVKNDSKNVADLLDGDIFCSPVSDAQPNHSGKEAFKTAPVAVPRKEEIKDNNNNNNSGAGDLFSIFGSEKSGGSSKNPDFKAFARAAQKEVQKENVAVVDITKLYSQPPKMNPPAPNVAANFNYQYYPNAVPNGYYNYGYPMPTYYPNNPYPVPTYPQPQPNLKNVDIKSLYGQVSSNNNNKLNTGVSVPLI